MTSPWSNPDSFTLEAKRLSWLIKHTVFAAERRTTHHVGVAATYPLKGMKIAFVQGVTDRVEFVATDGRRMAIASGICRRDSRATWPDSVVVPASKLRSLLKWLKTADAAALSVDVKQEALSITTSARTSPQGVMGSIVPLPLLEGRFPPYRDVMPDVRHFKHTARIDVKAFKDVLLRVAKACTDGPMEARLDFRPEGLLITTRADDSGFPGATVPTLWDGAPLEIDFDPVLLLDAIRVIGKGSITMSMTSSQGPCRIQPVISPESYTYLLMSLRQETNHG